MNIFKALLLPLLLVAVMSGNTFGDTTSQTLHTLNGNIGIGTTTPQSTFHVIGDSRFGDTDNYNSFNSNGDLNFIRSTGTLRILPFTDNGSESKLEFERLDDGVWNDAGIKVSGDTIDIGSNIGMGSAGQWVEITSAIDNERSLLPRTSFTVGSGTDHPICPILLPGTATVIQPDDSSEVITTSFNFTSTNPFLLLGSGINFKIGSVPATSPVSLTFRIGSSTGELMWERNFPASMFAGTSGTIVKIDLLGLLPGLASEQINTDLTSDTNFSIKTNAGQTEAWFELEYFPLTEGDMLHTDPWISGTNYSIGDWTIQNQRIYISNTTGTQTGTFDVNISRWDEVNGDRGHGVFNPVTLVEYLDGTTETTAQLNGRALHVGTSEYTGVSKSLSGIGVAAFQELIFKPDGKKIFLVDFVTDDIFQSNLGTPWDITNITSSQGFDVGAQTDSPTGAFISPDGTHVFVCGDTGDMISRYDMSTPWDVTTMSFVSQFSVTAWEIFPTGVYFKPDGLKMFVVGGISDNVDSFALTTAWDVTTATHVATFNISSGDTNPQGIKFNDDGMKFYTTGPANTGVREWNVHTPWDITTTTIGTVKSFVTQDTLPQSIYIRGDGLKMYLVGGQNTSIYAYDLGYFIAGNVGIGTTSPSATLDVQGGIEFSGHIVPETSDIYDLGSNSKRIRDIYMASVFDYKDDLTFQSETLHHATIDINGNLGLGTSSPSRLLHVNGNAEISGVLDVGGIDNVNVAYVKSIADFPSPITGVINLIDNTRYIGDGHETTITLSDNIKFGSNTRLELLSITTSAGFSSDVDFEFQNCIITYTGTGTVLDMPSMIDTSIMDDCSFFLTSSGTLFDLNSVTANTAFVANVAGFVSLAGSANVGTISDITVGMSTIRSLGFGGGGLRFEDNDSVGLSEYVSSAANTGVTHFEFAGTNQSNIQLSGVSPTVLPNDFAFDFDTGTSFDGVVTVTACTLNDSDRVFGATSFDNTTVGFKFFGNAHIPDSTANIDIGALDQGGSQTLLDQNQIQRIQALFTEVGGERFTSNGSGTVHYLGQEQTSLLVTSTITGTLSSGIGIRGKFYIVRGNTLNTILSFADAGAGTLTVTTSLPHDYANGDRIIIEDTASYDDDHTIFGVGTLTFNINDTWVATGTGTHAKALVKSVASNDFSGANKNTTLIALLPNVKTDDCMYIGVENIDTGAEWETEDIHEIYIK